MVLHVSHQSCAACTGQGAATHGEVTAICDVLSALLAVEHRAVQPHLSHIWQLLWLVAQGTALMHHANPKP